MTYILAYRIVVQSTRPDPYERPTMKSLIAAILCLLLPVSALAESAGYKVIYDGGSIPEKAGTPVYLYIEANQVRLTQKSVVLATIQATAVTEISYGQDVHRRVGTTIGLAVISLGIGALMLLSKSKKHFVGITWVDGLKKGGFVMQCDKNDYRGILLGLEGSLARNPSIRTP
jgi:hypothetical protein